MRISCVIFLWNRIDKPAQPVDSGDENLEISDKQPEDEDSATAVEAKLETVAKPKLSVANDSFFSNDNSVRSKTPEVNKLVQR